MDSFYNPINFVSGLPASLSYQCSVVVSVLCKPIGAKLRPISEHRVNFNSRSDCYLHIRKYHLVHRRPNTRFYGACKTYANFFYLIPILCRFRIIRCNQQGALHSALFNYTPLVIKGTDKNKQVTIINPLLYGGGPIGPPFFEGLKLKISFRTKIQKNYVFLPKYVNYIFLINFSVSMASYVFLKRFVKLL